jgi:hypothetical protein
MQGLFRRSARAVRTLQWRMVLFSPLVRSCPSCIRRGCVEKTQERRWSLGSPEDRPLFQAAIPTSCPTTAPGRQIFSCYPSEQQINALPSRIHRPIQVPVLVFHLHIGFVDPVGFVGRIRHLPLAQPEAQLPTHTDQDDWVFVMPPEKSIGGPIGHRFTLPQFDSGFSQHNRRWICHCRSRGA